MKKEALEIVESVIDGKDYFIVDTHISQIRGTWMIKISADSDSGISIDECGNLSRDINKHLESKFPDTGYELEITSPGVGEPIKLLRQYNKNIGRTLKLSLNDGKEVVGKLLKVEGEEKILVEEFEKKKGKIINTKQIEISFSEVKKTVVEISFN